MPDFAMQALRAIQTSCRRKMQCHPPRIAFLCLGVICFASLVYADVEMPHVDNCRECRVCHVGNPPPKTLARALLAQDMQPSKRELASLTGDANRVQHMSVEDLADGTLAPSKDDSLRKQNLPVCDECYGCNTRLREMESESFFFNTTYENEKGATSSFLFKANAPGDTSKEAVVKVYCVPVPKRPGAKIAVCTQRPVLTKMKIYLALQAISEECGFDDIVPKVWVDKVNAVMPNVGYHIRWYGLWMELVQGVSMENFLNKGQPRRVHPQSVLDFMHSKLNGTQVIRASIFDLLTSQCDRHAQNIFIDEQGQLKLIDNEASLLAWRTCGFDSVFIPTSQKKTIVHFNNAYVLKLTQLTDAQMTMADPQLLLDYRCYLPQGQTQIGTDYHPQIKKCLARISSLTPSQAQEEYGLEEEAAQAIVNRAADMLNKGFEWTIKNGEPRNPVSKRYLMQTPCCRLSWAGHYRCEDPGYKPEFAIPFGDPTTGREWKKLKPDIGTYEGGSRW